MLKISLTVILGICLILVSCNNPHNAIKDTIGKQVMTSITDTLKTKYSILRYINNPSCTSCQLHAGGWKTYRRKIHKKYQDYVKIIFVIETKKVEEAERLMRMYKPADVYMVDTVISFLHDNQFHSGLGKDFVVLLDSTCRVIAVSNPCESKKAEDLIYHLIDNNITFDNTEKISN